MESFGQGSRQVSHKDLAMPAISAMERHIDPLIIVLVVVRAGEVLKVQAPAPRVVNESAVGSSELGVGVG